MMLLRAVCLIAGAVIVSTKPPLWGLWLALAIAAMVLLPWFAVSAPHDQAALPSQASHRIIDHD
jgi:hypothetical protein